MECFPVPTSEIVALTQALVRIPSQGGIDDCRQVIALLESWLEENSIKSRILRRDGVEVGVLATVDSEKPGPTVCLDAPIDTAPIGRTDDWTDPPLSGMLKNDRIYGRGAADCKVAASIFCHLARQLSSTRSVQSGTLHILLEADEHTGNFGCIKQLLDEGIQPSFLAIGYPGNYGVVVGARGFLRLRIKVIGKNAHSGSKKETNSENALLKAAALVVLLSQLSFPSEEDPDFSFGPKLSVTAFECGSGFSQVPGEATINVDIRLTPGFDAEAARSLVINVVRHHDIAMSTVRETEVDELKTWPAYKLAPDHFYSNSLRKAAERILGRDVPPVVCGPSNIANFLAGRGVESTCGFGVTYRNIHASDEYVEVLTIEPIYRSYKSAVEEWLG